MKRFKKDYMSAETFSALMEAAQQALAYERGARDGYHMTQMAISKTSLPVPSKRGTSSTRGYRTMKYKGYKGAVTLDEDVKIFYGEVVNARDVITFQGASLEECKQAFHNSVDDYLEFCRERDEEPDKPI
jgi:predicted RNase H-like HicB family nuclease